MKTRSDNEQQLKEYVPINIKNLRDEVINTLQGTVDAEKELFQ
jgi:hypothetical protein